MLNHSFPEKREKGRQTVSDLALHTVTETEAALVVLKYSKPMKWLSKCNAIRQNTSFRNILGIKKKNPPSRL